MCSHLVAFWRTFMLRIYWVLMLKWSVAAALSVSVTRCAEISFRKFFISCSLFFVQLATDFAFDPFVAVHCAVVLIDVLGYIKQIL